MLISVLNTIYNYTTVLLFASCISLYIYILYRIVLTSVQQFSLNAGLLKLHYISAPYACFPWVNVSICGVWFVTCMLIGQNSLVIGKNMLKQNWKLKLISWPCKQKISNTMNLLWYRYWSDKDNSKTIMVTLILQCFFVSKSIGISKQGW